MLTAASVLKIIELSLEIALVMVKDMTPEQRQAFWVRHEERMAFFQGLIPSNGD